MNGRGDLVSVAATDENDAAASFTTYGTWVDVSAPGPGIYSTYHDHTDPNVDYWAALDWYFHGDSAGGRCGRVDLVAEPDLDRLAG